MQARMCRPACVCEGAKRLKVMTATESCGQLHTCRLPSPDLIIHRPCCVLAHALAIPAGTLASAPTFLLPCFLLQGRALRRPCRGGLVPQPLLVHNAVDCADAVVEAAGKNEHGWVPRFLGCCGRKPARGKGCPTLRLHCLSLQILSSSLGHRCLQGTEELDACWRNVVASRGGSCGGAGRGAAISVASPPRPGRHGESQQLGLQRTPALLALHSELPGVPLEPGALGGSERSDRKPDEKRAGREPGTAVWAGKKHEMPLQIEATPFLCTIRCARIFPRTTGLRSHEAAIQ